MIHTGDFQVRNFGLNLRRIWKEKGLSQDALARRLGTFKQVISRYENAERIPRITDAAKYAEALGVTLSELTEEAPPCSGAIGGERVEDTDKKVVEVEMRPHIVGVDEALVKAEKLVDTISTAKLLAGELTVLCEGLKVTATVD